MSIKNIGEYQLGDMTLVFEEETDYQRVGLYIYPTDMKDLVVTKDKFYRINSLVQLQLAGDILPNCYGNGSTMHNGESSNLMVYEGQDLLEDNHMIKIVTHFKDARGYRVDNIISYCQGDLSFEMKNRFYNNSKKTAILEMFGSFELGTLSPFLKGDGEEELLIHRLRSKWSHEGRLSTESVEDLQLEPSWSNWSVGVERFGQTGSMPVKKFFPFVAVEDKKNKALWGVKLAHEASWQMEIYRQDQGLHICGGLADYEFGHWRKNIEVGREFETPVAIISTCKGDIDELCYRLVEADQKYVEAGPECEQELPVLFNEYCTTWGNPSEDNISDILTAIKDKGFSYFVIDCGWFKEKDVPWDISMGDYNVSKELFPSGLEKTVEKIHEFGMKAGIWFEIDNVGPRAKAFEETDHLLKRNGNTITTYGRRFWDMTDPWVEDYLSKKVIGTLKEYGFEYMKMDYNDTIGIGCDGSESLGEGLRKNMDASMEFIRKVKKEVPGIILENCASGGHKLEPMMMRECAMASFSDAHETEEIPYIALNLHRAILPRQSQIWAVIRKDDSLKRIGYSIANTFLGRMCLSGDVTELSKQQWDVIDRGIAFYKEAAQIIKNGRSYRFGPKIESERHIKGWQALVRLGTNGQALVVLHTFHGELPKEIVIDLPEACPKEIIRTYSDLDPKVRIEDGKFIYETDENMRGVGVLLG